MRCALEGEAYANRGSFASLMLKKAFSVKLEQLAALTTEANLEEIDITPHLPTYSDYCLTEKDKAYLDFLFDAQSFHTLYEYTVDAKEYCQIDDRIVTSIPTRQEIENGRFTSEDYTNAFISSNWKPKRTTRDSHHASDWLYSRDLLRKQKEGIEFFVLYLF